MMCAAIKALSERVDLLMSRYYELGMVLPEIRTGMCVSESRLSRLHNRQLRTAGKTGT